MNTTTTWEREVPLSARGQRLDAFWSTELKDEGISRGKVKKWIEAGYAYVNDKPVIKGKYKLAGDETLSLRPEIAPLQDSAPQAVECDLEVMYEDDDLAVVYKPARLTTHPAPTEKGPTLVNWLLHRWPEIASTHSGMDEQRPGIVHRLDKDTSGIMVIARNEKTRLALSTQFADRSVQKAYLALVHGIPDEPTGTIDAPLGRHPINKTKMAIAEKGGRNALSTYKTIWSAPNKSASLMLIHIHTGRTHQIRVHMASIGHPLLGDEIYGSSDNARWLGQDSPLAKLAPRQMLHAFSLAVTHPESGETLAFFRPPPADFITLLAALNHRTARVGITGMAGCGKSTFTNILKELGRPTFNADECIKEMYEAGHDAAQLILQRFGGKFSNEDGSVDKPILFDAMKNNDAIRLEIMQMTHPMVQHHCAQFFVKHQVAPLAFAEIPLLAESNWIKKELVDYSIYLDCPDSMRLGTLRESRGITLDQLATFDSWQWSADQKKTTCSFVAQNNSSVDKLKAEALKCVQAIEAEETQREENFKAWQDTIWSQLAISNVDEKQNI